MYNPDEDRDIFIATSLVMTKQTKTTGVLHPQTLTTEIESVKEAVGRSKEVVNSLTSIQVNLVKAATSVHNMWRCLRALVLIALGITVMQLFVLYFRDESIDSISLMYPLTTSALLLLFASLIYHISSNAQIQIASEVIESAKSVSREDTVKLSDSVKDQVKTFSTCLTVMVTFDIFAVFLFIYAGYNFIDIL